MQLSAYKKSEKTEIKYLVEAAFSQTEGQEEGRLIANLAADLIDKTNDEDIRAFTAKDGGIITGIVFFTRLSFEVPIKVFIMAPVAVHIEYQGKGIGQKLINYGLEQLKKQGIEIALTYGDPDYYCKTGFFPITKDIIKAPQPLSMPQGWIGQSLTSESIQPIPGASTCVEALNKPQYW